MAKKRNPQDGTRVNITASNLKHADHRRRLKALEQRVKKLEKLVTRKRKPSVRGSDDDNIVWGT